MSLNGSVDELIFYKENKTPEEVKQFWKMFLREFGARVEEIEVDGRKIKRLVFEEPVIAPGFVFPKTPNDFGWFINYADNSGHTWEGRNPFENAVFKKETIFYKAVFEGPISFKGAIFGRETHDAVKVLQNSLLGKILLQRDDLPKEIEIGARFDEAIFLDVVTFKNAVFKSSVSFSGTVFKKGALFDGCKFLGKQADFSDSKFYRFEQEDSQNSTLVLGADEPVLLGCSSLGIGACFNGVTFRCGVDFRNAKMEGASFMNAFFVKESTFEEAQFNGFAIFISAKFGDKVSFKSVKFHDDVTFSGVSIDVTSVLHSNAPFYEKLNMPSAQFYEEVTFQEAEFHSKTNFSKCQFRKGANFSGVMFDKGADFQWCVFLNKNVTPIKKNYSYPETTFAKSIFRNTAFFDFAEFGKAFFNFATFEKGASFNNATFHNEAWFKEVEFKKAVEFQAAEFNGKTTFDGSVFERVAVFVNEKRTLDEPTPKFHGELSFASCDFRQGADFLGSLKSETNLSKLWEFFSSRFPTPQAMIEALRVQRLSFEKEGKRDEADRMFVLEMRIKRKIRKSKLSENAIQKATSILGVKQLLKFQDRLTSWLFNSASTLEELLKLLVAIGPMIFVGLIMTLSIAVFQFLYLLGYIGEVILGDWVSLYGTSWERVIGVSLLVIIANAVPYTIWGHYIKGFPSNTGYFVRFANALYYSLVTFTTLGYGDMHPTGWLKALSAIEALTGAVFMALIVAVIARKWMR